MSKAEEAEMPPPGETNSGSKPRHYPPRQCRICLEVVQPTLVQPAESFAYFNPAPKVAYISADKSDGRLIRPCQCKGSSRYVHEGCLQAWRHADASYGTRNYWECPTCKFKYQLHRLKWSAWIGSTLLQVAMTVAILLGTVFILGFIADPIINLYLDPYDTIASIPSQSIPAIHLDEDDGGWIEHFAKGLASLGLLGMVKAFFLMGPWHWFNIRNSGLLGGTGRGRRGGTGRDRLENISWSLVLIGVATFLYATWKFVRNWSRRTLEAASEKIVDVQGEDDDFEEEDEPIPSEESSTAREDRTESPDTTTQSSL